jgi:predicted enzyme related to lactoylglutathione lyase
MKVTGFSWLGVGVDDFPAAVSFFEDVLGIMVAVRDGRGVAMLQVGERQVLEVFGPGTRGKELCTTPVMAFEVEDVANARAELVAHGVELIGDIGSWNGFEWLYFRGPGGHIFAVKKTPPDGWEANVS